mmetsp:Transcript_38949/g.34622  ORF Transcript_38949/g.34622 Transcript_38949/m.34622 type:complete len:295 (-) Transcript_38949:314-1198(-)
MAKEGFKNFVGTQPEALIMLKEAVTHKHEDAFGTLTKLHLMSMLQAPIENGEEYQGLTEDELNAEFDTSARTESEIGTGHVDNDKGALGLNNYDYTDENLEDYIRQTLAFIDELIAEFQADRDEIQDSEEQAVHSFLKFKTEIERQNHVLNLYIQQCVEHIEKLAKTIAANEAAHAECVAQIPPLETQLQTSQQAYADAKEAYETRRTKIENTIPVLEKAIQVYSQQVHGAANTYHERVEDYAPDQDFDQTNYENRETNASIDNFDATAGIGENEEEDEVLPGENAGAGSTATP